MRAEYEETWLWYPIQETGAVEELGYWNCVYCLAALAVISRLFSILILK